MATQGNRMLPLTWRKVLVVLPTVHARFWGPARDQGTKPPVCRLIEDDGRAWVDEAWTEAHLDDQARTRSAEMWRRLIEWDEMVDFAWLNEVDPIGGDAGDWDLLGG